MSVKRAIDSESALLRTARASRRWWLSGRHVTYLVAAGAMVAMTACSSTPAAPSKPTVQAVATQAVGAAQSGAATAVAGASPAAATAVAAASPAAATAQAAAAPAGATAVSVAGTAVGAIPSLASPSPSPSPAAQVPLRIADASLADATPWLSLQNDGTTPVDVGGWQLQVGAASAALPEDAVVQPGAALTIHAGEGMSSEDEVYLGDAGDLLASAAIPGTPVRLTDGTGRIVTEVTVPRF